MVAVVAVAAVAMSVAAGYGPARDPIETRLLYPSAVSKKKKEHVRIQTNVLLLTFVC